MVSYGWENHRRMKDAPIIEILTSQAFLVPDSVERPVVTGNLLNRLMLTSEIWGCNRLYD
jgi:hypothetical protein